MELEYAENWQKGNVDPSRWKHPLSKYLVENYSNEARGALFESWVVKWMKQEFPYLLYASRTFGESMSEGRPDIAFSFDKSERNKFIEVKSSQEKLKGKNKKKTYEVVRIHVYDDGEYGKANFDYIVFGFIDPVRGVIYRSMTHEQCVRGIELGIFKYRTQWGAYSFSINDIQDFRHTSLKMHDNLDVIKEYEKTEPDFLNIALDKDDTDSTMEAQLTFNF